jgi:hypothetical protein
MVMLSLNREPCWRVTHNEPRYPVFAPKRDAGSRSGLWRAMFAVVPIDFQKISAPRSDEPAHLRQLGSPRHPNSASRQILSVESFVRPPRTRPTAKTSPAAQSADTRAFGFWEVAEAPPSHSRGKNFAPAGHVLRCLGQRNIGRVDRGAQAPKKIR